MNTPNSPIPNLLTDDLFDANLKQRYLWDKVFKIASWFAVIFSIVILVVLMIDVFIDGLQHPNSVGSGHLFTLILTHDVDDGY